VAPYQGTHAGRTNLPVGALRLELFDGKPVRNLACQHLGWFQETLGAPLVALLLIALSLLSRLTLGAVPSPAPGDAFEKQWLFERGERFEPECLPR